METYLSLLTNLKVRNIRLNSYWREIETTDNEYYFENGIKGEELINIIFKRIKINGISTYRGEDRLKIIIKDYFILLDIACTGQLNIAKSMSLPFPFEITIAFPFFPILKVLGAIMQHVSQPTHFFISIVNVFIK